MWKEELDKNFIVRTSAKNEQIILQFGETKLVTLRKIYGPAFAVGLSETMSLSAVIERMSSLGMGPIHAHFDDASLPRRIAEASGNAADPKAGRS
jgi:hypothetical protein